MGSVVVGGKVIKYCYHAPKKIFEIDDVEYYAASASGVLDFKGDFVVNLSGSPNLPPSRYAELFAEFKLNFEEEVMVPWPDYRLPKVKLSFWPTLHKFIRSHGWQKVCIHCQAGHGRTGTAMAAMLIVNSGYSAYDAVHEIRILHCGEAVETFEQVRYLQFLDSHYNSRNQDDEPAIVPSNMFDKIRKPASLIPGIDDIDDIDDGTEDEEDLNNLLWEDEIDWEDDEDEEEEDGDVETDK